MTKTLTEQWREGKLKEGFYYILFASRFGEDYIAIDMFIQEEKDFMYSSCEDVKEVLAPVPSYEEYKDLYDSNKQLMTHIKTCEQQIEKLQEQLKEANEVIKTTNRLSGNIDLSQMVYEDRRKIDGITMQTESYLEKWGVK